MRAWFGFIIIINVMGAVNIRGHEANFCEAEARCHEAEIETEARKVRPRPNNLASRPHGPRGLNIPGRAIAAETLQRNVLIKTHLHQFVSYLAGVINLQMVLKVKSCCNCKSSARNVYPGTRVPVLFFHKVRDTLFLSDNLNTTARAVDAMHLHHKAGLQGWVKDRSIYPAGVAAVGSVSFEVALR